MPDSPAPTAPEPAAEPLLPAFFSRPAALALLWLVPIGLLLALNVRDYLLLAREMDAKQIALAHQLGFALVANFLVGAAIFGLALARHAGAAAVRSQWDAWGIPAAAIVAQAGYLWLALQSGSSALPRSVAPWVYSPDSFLYHQFAFAMPPLALGVLRLVTLGVPRSPGRATAVSLALALGAPALIFLIGVVGSALRATGRVTTALWVVTAIALGITMFVGVIRVLLIALRWARTRTPAAEWTAIFIVALALPFGGLALNRSIPFPVDFQAWEVYALTAANAAALLLAAWLRERRPRACLAVLAATFPFSLYFFVVFLPFTPLSILAVVFFGLGFLVLSPTLLFILHVHLLAQAARHARATWSPVRLAAMAAGCALILPAWFVARAAADRAALHAALDYVHVPAIPAGDRSYPGSLANLRRALASHRAYKAGISYPLLTDFYGWFVFNRLVLPDEKIARLEMAFFGDAAEARRPGLRPSGFLGSPRRSVRDQSRAPRVAALPRKVEVARLALSATPAGDHATTITLALTLANPDQKSRVGDEYVAVLPLPAGAFVSGFRLHVNGTAVPGRIFEQKSALWVYSMIRDTERRDPGVLFYRSATELELRVFPVIGGTPAQVAIDFVVPGRVGLDPAAGDTRDPAAALSALGPRIVPQLAPDPRGALLAGDLTRLRLPIAPREPYLHVIVDRSRDLGFTGDAAAAVRRLREKFPAVRQARVTLAHHDLVETAPALTPLADLAAQNRLDVRLLAASGSLSLDLALAHAIRRHRDADLDQPASGGAPPPRPIFVVLSDRPAPRSLALEHTAAWRDLLPALEVHELGAEGTWRELVAAPATDTPLLRFGASVRPLVAGRVARFAPEKESAPLEFWSGPAAGWQPVPNLTRAPIATPWMLAAAVHRLHDDFARSPGDSLLSLRELVAASRASGVLLPATSYIVVENSAQWLALEQAEQRKLSQNTALEFRETPAPPGLVVAAGFIAWLAWRRRRQRPRRKNNFHLARNPGRAAQGVEPRHMADAAAVGRQRGPSVGAVLLQRGSRPRCR